LYRNSIYPTFVIVKQKNINMEFVRSINWELLKKQKETLVRLAGENSNNTCLSKAEQSDLDGVVHLIDAVQDWAVQEQNVAEDLVFPNLEEEAMKTDIIEVINTIIGKHGMFSVSDVHADRSPVIETTGKLSHLMEDFHEHQGLVYVYDPSGRSDSSSLEEYNEEYYQLSLSELKYVLSLAYTWAEMNE
jgi:hypothetical protein